jgi:3-phenylpropionate/cinnamic acid dioxygenase small subunit
MKGLSVSTKLLEEEFVKQVIGNLVQTTGALLDREDFKGWLALFDEHSQYELTAYSAEIRQQMSWWKSDRISLEKILKEIPRHVRDPGSRLHLVTPTSIDVSGDSARAISSFAVFRTTPDGETRVYAVGHYEDDLVMKAERWFYVTHKVVLQTRLLEAPTHVPI